MKRRKASRARIVRKMVEPDRLPLVDDGPDEAASLEKVADHCRLLAADPDLDELFETAIRCNYSKGTEPGVDKGDGGLGNSAQQLFQLKFPDDDPVGFEELAEAPLGVEWGTSGIADPLVGRVGVDHRILPTCRMLASLAR